MAEYRSLSRSRRLAYRLYRNPVVIFGIGPIWLFLFKQRLPFGMMRSGMEPWVSTMATNLAILVLALGLIWLVDVGSFRLVQLPVVVLAGSAGIWLFYDQHQFEETHWSQKPQWQFQDAALHGTALSPAMADGQYRQSSPSFAQGAILPASGGAEGLSGTARHRPYHHHGKPPLREARPLG